MNENTANEQYPAPAEEIGEKKNEAQVSAEKQDRTELERENERLQNEVDALKAQIFENREKAEAEEYLAMLAGGRDDRLYAEAIRQSAEREEWKTLPYKQRYELAYYLCLGREKHALKDREAPASPPAFARSGGHGDSPSMPMKTPTNFEMARENAMKYFARG